MRIGLSYHGGDHDYDAYAGALERQAQVLGIALEIVWLGGRGLPPRSDALSGLDGLVFTGGPDVEVWRYGREDAAALCRSDPQRDALEWTMLERWRDRPLPLLAICRGAQLLNVFHGGTLIPDLGERNRVHRREEDERRLHDVAIAEGSLLEEIAQAPGGLVNSSHHQAVDRLAGVFRPSASSWDGVLEAFEPAAPAGGPFTLAIQWHPEAMDPGLPLADRVLDAFLRALRP